MKVLSVRQPWAWAIFHGGKDIENRTWSTHYRGPLAIHASSVRTPQKYWVELQDKKCRVPDKDELPTSVILGVVDLVDVVEKSRSRWHMDGYYGFVFRNPRLLVKPLRAHGWLNLWEPRPAHKRILMSLAGQRKRRG